jgi:transposase
MLTPDIDSGPLGTPVGPRSVRRWKAAVRKSGANAVAAKPAAGQPRRLTKRDLTRLYAKYEPAQTPTRVGNGPLGE